MLAVNQASARNRPLFTRGVQVAWVAEVPRSPDRYLALFNLGDEEAAVEASWSELGLPRTCAVRDLWEGRDVGDMQEKLALKLPPHGAGLYRIRPREQR